jgi:hypothetical protein
MTREATSSILSVPVTQALVPRPLQCFRPFKPLLVPRQQSKAHAERHSTSDPITQVLAAPLGQGELANSEVSPIGPVFTSNLISLAPRTAPNGAAARLPRITSRVTVLSTSLLPASTMRLAAPPPKAVTPTHTQAIRSLARYSRRLVAAARPLPPNALLPKAASPSALHQVPTMDAPPRNTVARSSRPLMFAALTTPR